MNDEKIYTTLTTLISFLGISYLFLWEYRKYRIELFRQQMFVLRDELFDTAASGLIDFDHPSYGMLRSTMNGFIRFAHRPMALAMPFTITALRDYTLVTQTSFERDFNDRIASMTHDARETMTAFKSRMDRLAVKHLMFGSPEIILLLLVLSPLFLFVAILGAVLIVVKRRRASKLKNLVRSRVQKIDDTAFVLGQ